jgi:hypothetical protein
LIFFSSKIQEIADISTPAQSTTTGPTTPSNVTRRVYAFFSRLYQSLDLIFGFNSQRTSSFSYDDRKENGNEED